MTPQEALRRIDALEKFGMRLGLERVAAGLEVLGNPHRGYATVHVAGTNGKGSTALFTAEILNRAGYRTGLYTSPPLERFGERVRVGGAELPESEVPSLLEDVLAVEGGLAGGDRFTQFEVITLMAFLHFARAGVDAAVVEVGLGGRLDATNVIVPEVSVITNVGLEHAEHLGPTVRHVAREKAGIVKPGVPAVTAAEGDALEALEEAASAAGAPLRVWGRDFRCEAVPDGTFRFAGRRWHLPGLRSGLAGGFQGRNLGTSLAALEVLEEKGWSVPSSAVRQGVEEARWPGRLEVLGSGPRVVLDGAHNPHASRVLAEALRADLSYRRLLLVVGILGDKDARSILADLLPLASEVFVTRSASARARDPAELERLAQEVGPVPLHHLPAVSQAVTAALGRAAPEDLVCVTGSLTTVGEARAHLRSLGWIA